MTYGTYVRRKNGVKRRVTLSERCNETTLRDLRTGINRRRADVPAARGPGQTGKKLTDLGWKSTKLSHSCETTPHFERRRTAMLRRHHPAYADARLPRLSSTTYSYQSPPPGRANRRARHIENTLRRRFFALAGKIRGDRKASQIVSLSQTSQLGYPAFLPSLRRDSRGVQGAR